MAFTFEGGPIYTIRKDFDSNSVSLNTFVPTGGFFALVFGTSPVADGVDAIVHIGGGGERMADGTPPKWYLKENSKYVELATVPK